MTATPERADGLPVLQWFGGAVAAEMRLWDAIDQHRLAPFVYYGIHDGTDLTSVPWRRGQGYDTAALTGVYTANHAWVRHVIHQFVQHVDDPAIMRCLGFCVGVAHARFMADQFNRHGIRAAAVSGESTARANEPCPSRAARRTIQAVFSVDLFNEGVDVPMVDTVLMLRPTDSATLFLQQLGRGLRLAPGKTVCTVLDFVGTHRKEFRFERRYRALLGGSRRDLETAIQTDFPSSRPDVISNLTAWQSDRIAEHPQSLPVDLAREGRRAADARRRPARHHPRRVPVRDRIRALRTCTRMAAVGLSSSGGGIADRAPPGRPSEHYVGQSAGCFTSTTDSAGRVPNGCSKGHPRTSTLLSPAERALVRMLVVSLAGSAYDSRSTRSNRALIWCGRIRRSGRSFAELLPILGRQVDHLHKRSPRRSVAGPRALHPHRDPRGGRRGERGAAAAVAGRRLQRQGGRRGPAGLHPRQDQRTVLADHSLSRLRDQSRPDPLGESVDDPRRTARPDGDTGTTSRWRGRSCCSPGTRG